MIILLEPLNLENLENLEKKALFVGKTRNSNHVDDNALSSICLLKYFLLTTA